MGKAEVRRIYIERGAPSFGAETPPAPARRHKTTPMSSEALPGVAPHYPTPSALALARSRQVLSALQRWDDAVGGGGGEGSGIPRRSPAADGSSPPPSAHPSTTTCRPWSRVDFAVRCATYTLGRWFGKPLAVGPMECARHGWLSDAADMLRCESCAARLCVKVPDALSIEDVQMLVCTLHARLESGTSPLM